MANNKQKAPENSVDMVTQSEVFVQKYKKQIIYVLVFIVALVAAFWGLKTYKNGQEGKAQAQVSQAMPYLLQGLQGDSASVDLALMGDKAQKFDGLLQTIKKYSSFLPFLSTDGANVANYLAGLCYNQKGDMKNAIKYLEAFSPQSDNTVSPQAVAALANCYAKNNQVDKAIESLKKAAKKADNAAFSPIYLLQAGQLLENAKKYDEAIEIYESIKEDYPTSALSAQTEMPSGLSDAQIERYIERAKMEKEAK